MLPDFPELKADLMGRLQRFLEMQMLRHLGPLSESPRVHFFEGESRTMIRASGDIDTIEPYEIASTISFKDDELPTLSLDNLLEQLDSAAQDMAGQVARHTYDTITEAVKKVGNMVDAKQTRFSAEMILDGLAKMRIEFDQHGRPRMPAFHCHPDLEKAVQLALEELERTPELRKQLVDLLISKQEESRVREASRKLVG